MILFNEIMGLYTLPHILLMLIFIGCSILGLVIINKKVNDEKSLTLLLRILGIAILLFLIPARISFVYHNIQEGTVQLFLGEPRKFNWFMVLPNSFCATGAVVLSIALILGKYKNNVVIDAIFAIVVIGAITNVFYPEYLARLPFYHFQTWASLVYHVIMGFTAIVLLMKKCYVPELKNWYVPVIGISLILTYGLFGATVLKFADSFYIGAPLVAGLEVSYWWGLVLGTLLFDLAIRLTFHFINKNKSISK